jgi:hypothetical protein
MQTTMTQITDAPKDNYETPTITPMSDDEVLRLFQITASEIGAAAVWWAATCVAC